MPTTRRRYAVTETPKLERALDAAAQIWPEDHDDRGALIRRILAEGADRVTASEEDRRTQRLATLSRLSGSLTGLYPAGEHERMRHEWPA